MAGSNSQKNFVVIIVGVALVGMIALQLFKQVPVGHVAVATLFGNAQQDGYEQGMHFPVNPLYRWTMFDARQQTHQETANVPSQDQLQTKIDVSVQYRIDGAMAPDILEQTGDAATVVRVHLIPALRSLLREQGKEHQACRGLFSGRNSGEPADSPGGRSSRPSGAKGCHRLGGVDPGHYVAALHRAGY